MKKVLQFEGSSEELIGQIGQFKAQLEADRRKGWFGLAGLFFKSLPKEELAKIGLAKQVVAQVGRDAKKNQLSGWLDLSGYNSKGKLVRRGRTRSGRTKAYYRDPWFGVKAKLVDSNVVRVTAIDRVKEKKGWPVKHPAFAVKLGVNERVYAISQPGAKLSNISLGKTPPLAVSTEAKDGQVRLVATGGAAVPLRAEAVFSGLKSAYECIVLRRKLAKSGGN